MRILISRFQAQGARTTLVWMYARGLHKLTGVLVVGYSRITPEIYVGPQHGQRLLPKLERWGINGCINMREEFDDAAHGLALPHYCYLPTVDDAPPTAEHLLRGVEFIARVIGEGGRVYIHCAGGIGRAPTMAAAYFIAQGLSCAEAIALIKRSRPFINITPLQLAQLERFSALVKEQGSPASPNWASNKRI